MNLFCRTEKLFFYLQIKAGYFYWEERMKSKQSIIIKNKQWRWLLIVMVTAIIYLTGIDVNAAGVLSNPQATVDLNMVAGKKVTWDCIWFGSYPQAEVITSEMSKNYTAVNSIYFQDKDIVVSDDIYNELQKSLQWDINNDIVINGDKYRRIKKEDAVFATSGVGEYYNWLNDNTYHYFKYEPIKWKILQTNNNQALVISDIALDCQRYNTVNAEVSWKTSTIRSWLNGYDASFNQQNVDYTNRNFISVAFSQAENSKIINTNIENEDGSSIADKIFLLSKSQVSGTNEAISYGFVEDEAINDEAKDCKSSTYAKAMGVYTDLWWTASGGYEYKSSWWWLRSDSNMDTTNSYKNSVVHSYRHLGVANTDGNGSVRIALTLDLSSNIYRYAGTVCSDGSVNEKNTEIEGGDSNSGRIVSLTPESGFQYAELTQFICYIDFDKEINITSKGYAYLFSYDTDELVKRIELNPTSTERIDADVEQGIIGKTNRLKLTFKSNYSDGIKLEKDKKYYVLLDPNVIGFWNYAGGGDDGVSLGKNFEGIQNKEYWILKTTSTEYSKLKNTDMSGEIDYDLYKVLWKPRTAEIIKKNNADGKTGICFGLAYSAGAWKQKFSALQRIGKDSTLIELEKDSMGESSYDFLEYAQLAFLYQYTSDSSTEFKSNKNQYEKIYQEICDYQKGIGNPIILGIYDNGGHALMPLGIINESDQIIEIAVYDCNANGIINNGDRCEYIRTFIMEKVGGEIVNWKYGEKNGANKDARIEFGYIDSILDNIVELNDTPRNTKNLLYSKVELDDNTLIPLSEMGVNKNINKNKLFLYWTDSTIITRSPGQSGDLSEIGMTDGYNEISVLAPLNAQAFLDLKKNISKIEFIQSNEEKAYKVSYNKTDNHNSTENFTFEGKALNSITIEKGEEGFIICSDKFKNVIIEHMLFNKKESIIVNSDKDKILVCVENNHLTIYEDSNNDGIFDLNISDISCDHYFATRIIPATFNQNGNMISKCMKCGYEEVISISAISRVELSATEYIYNGKKQIPIITVKDNDGDIIDESNYRTIYSGDCVDIGEYTITIIFQCNYSGETSKNFKIISSNSEGVFGGGISSDDNIDEEYNSNSIISKELNDCEKEQTNIKGRPANKESNRSDVFTGDKKILLAWIVSCIIAVSIIGMMLIKKFK